MTENPLMNFARKVELTVKLPSKGQWYDNGMIEYTPNSEVEVYPMLPKDELMLLNPDSLLSGQANISMIKSCCPSIKEPEKLLYPDANVLFLAIQKATYGDTLSLSITCPKCQEKIVELKDADKIAEAEKNGEIMVHPQENKFSISAIMENITYLESSYSALLSNGLEVVLHPTILGKKEKYSQIVYNQQKLMNVLKEYRFDDNTSDEDRLKISNDINSCYEKINEIGNHMIADCISYILLPDGTQVSDNDYIYEFIANTPSTIVSEIDKIIKRMNETGLPAEIEYECECCHHHWKGPLFGFNQSDFFGIGS